ncbi:MAG: phasin family protein [Micavibrio sp.]|nr:phasin family protein [Micavibrio sp.]
MAAQTTSFTDFFQNNNFSKFFEKYQTSAVDMQSFLETNRRNFLALSELSQTAFENFQDIATRHSEIVSQMMEDNSALAKELMSEGTPEEKIAKNTDIIKKIYERNMKSIKELSKAIDSSNEKTGAIINRRITSSLSEIKSSMEKTTKKAA